MECAPKVRFATDSRWRKQNSNHRSPSRGCRLILGEEKGPAVDQIVSKDAVLFTGDQWFESVFLQRRVYCEPDRSRSKSPPCGFQVVHPIVEIRAREADAGRPSKLTDAQQAEARRRRAEGATAVPFPIAISSTRCSRASRAS